MAQDLIELKLEPRSVLGKAVKHLRSQGKVPAVIHDHGHESIIVEGDGIAMAKVYQQAGKHHPIIISTDGKRYTAMIKTIEFEPRKHALNHIVFNAVTADQQVEAEVPIEPKFSEGNEASPAERSGLIVLKNLETVEVEALPKDLPDALYYDAEKLINVGDQLTVADLLIPEKVVVTTDSTQAITTVYEPSALAAANDAAGGDEEETEAVVVSDETSDLEGQTEETTAKA